MGKFSILKRFESFKYALNGFRLLLKEEHNARIHLLAALLVTVLGCFLNLESMEWMALVFSMGFVFFAELINTAIENLADFVSPEWRDEIKVIKDLSAAAVLLSAIIALIIGAIVFLPKLGIKF